jgi:hypothetical protein
MTLKNKLAVLLELQNEEDRIKSEIINLRSNISDVELRQYNFVELRDKYITIDFNTITPHDLNDLMLNDFKESNLTEIEKQKLYNHNMNILSQVLDKTKNQNKRINNIKYNTIEEARNSINNIYATQQPNSHIQQTHSINNKHFTTNKKKLIHKIDINQTKQINITSNNNNNNDNSDIELDEYDEQYLEKLNNKIDNEYNFALKILKTYCIFCHYRNIKLPNQNELDYIKEELEGWQFVPKEEFKTIKYNTQLYFLYIKDFKIILGKGYYKQINKWGISIYINKRKETEKLNNLNPIFKKITDIDV